MTNLINAIPTYVLTVVISTVFILLIKGVSSYIHAKALHAKTAQSKELWSLMDQLASTAVASLVSADKTGDQKFAEATTIVQDALTKQGFTTVDVKAIEAAVQAAYEKSPLTPTTNFEEMPDKLRQKQAISVRPGSVVAIDPKEVK